MTAAAKPDPLAILRAPFEASHISKLPKPTKQQTKDVAEDYKKGRRCNLCGSWHHPDVVHLDYVGHAALTDRLLDADPMWSWEPVAFHEGLPAFDATGGLWIRLTVGGVSRLGYGHAAAKSYGDPGSREKEVIGDALRNAAMRFGAALDLWHKGDLHGPSENGDTGDSQEAGDKPSAAFTKAMADINGQPSWPDLKTYWQAQQDGVKALVSDAEWDELGALFAAKRHVLTVMAEAA